MSNLGPNTGMGDKTDRGRNSDIYGNYEKILYKVLEYILKYFVKMYLSTSKSSFEKKYSSTGKSTSTLYSRTYFVLKYKVLPKSD